MVITEKIEPCPSCGKYDPIIKLSNDNFFRVICQSCYRRGIKMSSPNEAIWEWNKSAQYYHNIGIEKMNGKEIKKIIQCKNCGYTCLEEECRVRTFGAYKYVEYTYNGWEEWSDLICPQCKEPIG